MNALPPWYEDGEARRAFVRERALIDERSELQAAERRGEQRGEQRKSIGTALKMIRANQFNDAMIAEFTDLTEEEVRRLRTTQSI